MSASGRKFPMDIEREAFMAGYDAGFFNGKRALRDGLHPKGYSRDEAWKRFEETGGISNPTDGVEGVDTGC